MIEVELKEYINVLDTQLKDALLKHELYGIQDFDSIVETLTMLKSALETTSDVYIPLQEHAIDKYGLGEMVIKFRNSNYSLKQIAEIITVQAGVIISEKDVKQWTDTYSTVNVSKRPVGHGNLFDIQERMQDVYGQLMDHLETVKQSEKAEFWQAKTTKQQVVLDIYKEIRMITKDASNIIQAISHQEQLQEFRKAVLESIKEISPSVQQAIIRKLKQNRTLYSSLLPGS